VAIVLFDKMAIVAGHTILLEHNIGIDTNILEYLLMPNMIEIEIVRYLKEYIEQRNARAKYASLIDTNIGGPDWFGTRFAAKSQDMCNVQREILLFAENKKQEKMNELIKACRLYKERVDRANILKCKCMCILFLCEKCTILAQARSMTVDVYEFPLPADDFRQKAVVFELGIPDAIASLRDSLYILNNRVLKINNSSNCLSKWIDYKEITKWRIGKQKFITLGSTTKLFIESHYKQPHVTSPNESFFKPNGYNLHLVEIKKSKLIGYDSCEKISIYQRLCTFKTEGWFI
jgi:hypothetical protein